MRNKYILLNPGKYNFEKIENIIMWDIFLKWKVKKALTPEENVAAFKNRFKITPEQFKDLNDSSKLLGYILEDWEWNGEDFGRIELGEFMAVLLKQNVISSKGSLLEIVTQAYDFFKLNLNAKVRKGFSSPDSLRKAVQEGMYSFEFSEVPSDYKFILNNNKNRIPNSSKRNKRR